MTKFLTASVVLAAASGVLSQSCPPVQVYGARETTVSPGYGSAGTLVNQVVSAYPGAQAAAITYPACGGQASCGGIQYNDSATQGTNNVASTVNAFNQRCPNSQIVLIGYSQGGQIMDQAYCNGLFSAGAANQIKAVIEFGAPTFVAGLSYNVGTCSAQGFAARPRGFQCRNTGTKIQSYCDSRDPYCCTGNSQSVHQGYQGQFGSQALAFIRARVSTTGGGNPITTPPPTGGQTTTRPATTNPPTGGGNCAARWGQCGGQGWTGATCCQSGSTCRASNQWYSQCL